LITSISYIIHPYSCSYTSMISKKLARLRTASAGQTACAARISVASSYTCIPVRDSPRAARRPTSMVRKLTDGLTRKVDGIHGCIVGSIAYVPWGSPQASRSLEDGCWTHLLGSCFDTLNYIEPAMDGNLTGLTSLFIHHVIWDEKK